jgi:hypothetical protein
VSEHGQRGPNSGRAHARDGISRTASVPRGRGRRTGTQEKRRVQNRCDHIEQSSKWLGLSIVAPSGGHPARAACCAMAWTARASWLPDH